MVRHAATLMVLWAAAFLNPCTRAWSCTMHLDTAIPWLGCGSRVFQQATPAAYAAYAQGRDLAQPLVVETQGNSLLSLTSTSAT